MGRPKGAETQRTTLIIETELLQKVKYIAWHDRKTEKEVYSQGLQDLVKKWEKANQEITPEEIKKAGL